MTEMTGKTKIVVSAISAIMARMVRSERTKRSPSLNPLRRCSSSSAVPLVRGGKETSAMINAINEIALQKKAEAAPHQATNNPARNGPTKREP